MGRVIFSGTPHSKKGFTLIELSVVILVIGVVVGYSVMSSREITNSAKAAATKSKLDAIENSLMAFRRTNNRLPCPSDYTVAEDNIIFGKEAGEAINCNGGSANFPTSAHQATEGGVPFATLGLPKEFAYDGWGRRIAYAVYPEFARTDAFNHNSPRAQCVEAIHVLDANSNPRTSSAIYALISFGANGHGGRTSSGAVYSAQNVSASATAELKNCHCDNSGAATSYDGTYYQQDITDAKDATLYFDDYVRYKEVSQMQTEENALTDKGYNGPSLAIGLNASGDGHALLYNKQCGPTFTQLNPTINYGTDKITGLAFTKGGSQLIITSNTSLTATAPSPIGNKCDVYNISGSTISVGTPIPNCATYYDGSNVIGLSDNGYFAISESSAPYIKLWKKSGTTYVATADIVSAGFRPTSIAFSHNADFMSLSDATHISVYSRTGDTFKKMPTQPSGIVAANASVAFSPSGKYFAEAGPGSATINVWRIDNQTFTPLAAALTTGFASTAGLKGLTFSPDGRYMVVGDSSKNMVIYKIDPNDVFTALTPQSSWTAAKPGIAFAFSADSYWLALLSADSTVPVSLFRRISPTVYDLDSEITPVPTGAAGSAIAFVR